MSDFNQFGRRLHGLIRACISDQFLFNVADPFKCNKKKLEDLKVLRRSPDLLNNVKIGQGQLQLIIKHILFYHIWGLKPFWSSDIKQSNEYPSNNLVISEKKVFRYIGIWQSKLVALDKRSKVSLTLGTYI